MSTDYAISSVVEGNKRVVGIGLNIPALVASKMLMVADLMVERVVHRVVVAKAIGVVVLGAYSCVLLLATNKTITPLVSLISTWMGRKKWLWFGDEMVKMRVFLKQLVKRGCLISSDSFYR